MTIAYYDTLSPLYDTYKLNLFAVHICAILAKTGVHMCDILQKYEKNTAFLRESGVLSNHPLFCCKIHIALEQAEACFGFGLFINRRDVPLHHPPGDIQAVGNFLYAVLGRQ